jgi:hypothetical protein
LFEFRLFLSASADAKRQLRRERNVRKRGREADWQSQKERKTADERLGAENEKARTDGDFAEPPKDEKSSPIRRRVES